MTRSLPKSLPATLALLCIVMASCGDDDNPAAADNPCADANTVCLTITLTDDNMTHDASYDPSDDITSHLLSWDVSDLVIRNYAPGQRIMVTIIFDPPIDVRYDHPNQSFALYAGATGNMDRFSQPTLSVDANDWTPSGIAATCRGEVGTGASALSLLAIFSPMIEGTSLHRVAFDCVIPDTYESGVSNGTPILPGNLDIMFLQMDTIVDGEATGNPPVWPGDFVPR